MYTNYHISFNEPEHPNLDSLQIFCVCRHGPNVGIIHQDYSLFLLNTDVNVPDDGPPPNLTEIAHMDCQHIDS